MRNQAKAEYKIIDKKRFLKIGDRFKEVKLKSFLDGKGKSFLKVCPV